MERSMVVKCSTTCQAKPLISRAVPTNVALVHRNIIKSHEKSICDWYKKEVESHIYLMIHCQKIQAFISK